MATRILHLTSRRFCLTLMLTIVLNAAVVSSFCAANSKARWPSLFSSKTLPKSLAQSDNAATLAPSSNLFAGDGVVSNPKSRITILPIAFRFIRGLRNNIARVIAIFSFAFFAYASPRPAFAWGKTTETVVTKMDTPTGVKKLFLKCIVTGGAVAAGAATATKVRALSSNKDEDDTVVDAKINADEKDAPMNSAVVSPKQKSTSTYKIKPGAPLVKDLDAKIERLREQERLAIQHAADNIAKGKTAKAEQMAKDVAENQRNQVEERIAKIAEEERNKIAAIEKEREEQSKIAKEKIAAVESERLERIAVQEASVKQSKIEKEMEHKVTQMSAPAHADDSRMLVEHDSAKERMLAEKYAAMGSEEERAFNILVDLGMVELHPDEFEDADDDNVDPSNIFL